MLEGLCMDEAVDGTLVDFIGKSPSPQPRLDQYLQASKFLSGLLDVLRVSRSVLYHSWFHAA